MNTASTRLAGYLVPFGILVFFLDKFCVPKFGMAICAAVSAFLILILLGLYISIAQGELDERERLLRLQADSAALYVVIAALLAATIFYPRSEFAMVFWSVIGVAVLSRIISFIYQRYT